LDGAGCLLRCDEGCRATLVPDDAELAPTLARLFKCHRMIVERSRIARRPVLRLGDGDIG
jgi:hypothetical protein